MPYRLPPRLRNTSPGDDRSPGRHQYVNQVFQPTPKLHFSARVSSLQHGPPTVCGTSSGAQYICPLEGAGLVAGSSCPLFRATISTAPELGLPRTRCRIQSELTFRGSRKSFHIIFHSPSSSSSHVLSMCELEVSAERCRTESCNSMG